MTIRSYTELSRIDTFEERFKYLQLNGVVGEQTFGHERWLNQRFYSSREWKQVRNVVIARDLGCDLGIEGMEIYDRVYIHHINPMRPDDIIHARGSNLDPEYLISVSFNTHQAIHFSDESLLPKPYVERKPRDHILW